jgi:carboxyl-terminal processing protease
MVAAGLSGALCAMSSLLLASPPPTKDADDATTANITRLTTAQLEGSQLSHHPLDDQMAAKLLERYLESLDGTRSLFLESDVTEFAARLPGLAEATRTNGDTRAARVILNRYLARLAEQVVYDDRLLRTGVFDFTGHDVYAFDRKAAPRPRDEASARDLWRQELRSEYLQEKLNDARRRPDQIVSILKRRHARRLQDMKALGGDEVLELYLDALAHVYDPHSDYLGHETLQSLSIAASLSLVGVGASVTSKDGVCTIGEVVAGGPAALSGKLHPGDRVIAVANDGEPPVDVTGMPVKHVVELVRGSEGTAVTLTMLPAAGATGPARTLRLVRARVQIQEQLAKAWMVERPREGDPGPRLGFIELDSFYADGGGDRHHGAAADVDALLTRLKAEHVGGVVLDLRRNNGGSLDEAIRLTGLFIRSGPIFQARDSNNDVTVVDDPDPTVAYDGPLVVLTSRYSASASEIVAGALQDHGRAVIVGDSATFGKATVQVLTRLAPLMDRMGLGYAFDPGAVSVTAAKFYRPNGASPERRGVASDIVLPSPSEVSLSEASLPDALPWDVVPAARFHHEDRVARLLTPLQSLSGRRVARSKAFSALREEISRLKARNEAGTASLNEVERRQDMAASEARERDIDREAGAIAAAWTTYPITLENARKPGLPAPLELAGNARGGANGLWHVGGNTDASQSGSEGDIIAHEALLILDDYVRLVTPARPEAGRELSTSRATDMN